MAHFLDNDWHLFIITFDPVTQAPRIVPDGTFHLQHLASNQLDGTSKHGTNDLTGSSRPDGGGFEIRFSEAVPGGGAVKFRPYTGNLMDHKLVLGVEQKVIGGFRGRLLDSPLKSEEGLKPDESRSKDAFVGQNDGIWIATQP